jgi:hypothetical protein
MDGQTRTWTQTVARWQPEGLAGGPARGGHTERDRGTKAVLLLVSGIGQDSGSNRIHACVGKQWNVRDIERSEQGPGVRLDSGCRREDNSPITWTSSLITQS